MTYIFLLVLLYFWCFWYEHIFFLFGMHGTSSIEFFNRFIKFELIKCNVVVDFRWFLPLPQSIQTLQRLFIGFILVLANTLLELGLEDVGFILNKQILLIDWYALWFDELDHLIVVFDCHFILESRSVAICQSIIGHPWFMIQSDCCFVIVFSLSMFSHFYVNFSSIAVSIFKSAFCLYALIDHF